MADEVSFELRFPRDLHKRVKREALERDTSMNRLILAIIAEWMKANETTKERRP